MSVGDLFPEGGKRVLVREDLNPNSFFVLSECARCKAFVFDIYDHTRWHAAVDTAATTLLPSDPKGQS